jgi:hypothetical protein
MGTRSGRLRWSTASQRSMGQSLWAYPVLSDQGIHLIVPGISSQNHFYGFSSQHHYRRMNQNELNESADNLIGDTPSSLLLLWLDRSMNVSISGREFSPADREITLR